MDEPTVCWCGSPRPHSDPLTDLGHELITALRVPELTEWLAKHLIREKR